MKSAISVYGVAACEKLYEAEGASFFDRVIKFFDETTNDWQPEGIRVELESRPEFSIKGRILQNHMVNDISRRAEQKVNAALPGWYPAWGSPDAVKVLKPETAKLSIERLKNEGVDFDLIDEYGLCELWNKGFTFEERNLCMAAYIAQPELQGKPWTVNVPNEFYSKDWQGWLDTSTSGQKAKPEFHIYLANYKPLSYAQGMMALEKLKDAGTDFCVYEAGLISQYTDGKWLNPVQNAEGLKYDPYLLEGLAWMLIWLKNRYGVKCFHSLVGGLYYGLFTAGHGEHPIKILFTQGEAAFWEWLKEYRLKYFK